MGAASALQPTDKAPYQPPLGTSDGTDYGKLAGVLLGQIDTDESKETKLLAEQKANTPPLPPAELTQPPEPKSTSPVEQWGSVAMMFAVLGSMFTRTPMTTALNSAAGVMNAFRQGDQDAYNAQFQKWKASTDYAMKLYDFQSKQYDEAFKLLEHDQDSAYKKLEVLARTVHDHAMENLAATRNGLEALRLHDERGKNALEMEKLSGEIAQQREQGDILTGLHTARRNLQIAQASNDPKQLQDAQDAMDAAQQRATDYVAAYKGKDEGVPLTPEGRQFAAVDYLMTNKLPYLGFGQNAEREKIINLAADMAKQAHISPEQIISGQLTLHSMRQAQGRVETLATVSEGQEEAALKSLTLVKSLMNKGAGTADGPVVNRWFQAGRKATGDKDVAAFDTAVGAFTLEYAKIISGQTGASGSTDAARDKANEMFSQYGSPSQMMSQMAVMQKDMDYKVTSWADLSGRLQDRMGSLFPLGDEDEGGSGGAHLGSSRDSPAKPTTQQEFDALPPLSWFVNPKDGKILQKKQ